MSDFEALKAFRDTVYRCFNRRADANMNLLDALSSYGHRCKSVVELSEANCFERQYSSITDGIADGLGHCDWDQISGSLSKLAKPSKKPILLVTDCTPNPRSSAKTLEDRHVTHYPNPAPGNKPICVGHEYSSLAMVPMDAASRAKHWLIPLSVERVTSEQKGHEVGMKPIERHIDQADLKDRLVVSIADSKYATLACRERVNKQDHWVHLCRLNSTRNVYAAAEPSTEAIKKGCPRRYGAVMKLNDPNTQQKADETVKTTITTHSGRSCHMTIEVWKDRYFRGSRQIKGYQQGLTLYRIQLTDDTGRALYKKPMWLCTTGQRRQALTAEQVFEYYGYRYDIEHFFRFGKDKLLMAAYQTPEVKHEESWWKLTALAYVQLYFARDVVPLLPKKRERYLPQYQNVSDYDESVATPSQTQRAFAQVLDVVGTPARLCLPRGKPKGRSKGQTQPKRGRHEVVFKNKKTTQSDKKTIITGSEKTGQNSEPRKIKRLIKSVNVQLKKLGLNAEQFYHQLLESV